MHLLLAGDEGAPARLAHAGAADLHLSPVDPEFRASGCGAGEDVGQGAEPQARAAGDGEPAGGEQGADLADRPGDSRAVHPVKLRERGVRELEPQVNEGDNDAVGERQVMSRPGTRGAHALVTPAFTQPGLLSGRPGAGESGDELAEPSRLKAGEDTLAQGRAGPS